MTATGHPLGSRLRSVRGRVTIVVTALSAVAFAGLAAAAPAAVSDALEDDLVEAEAENAFAFTEILSIDADQLADVLSGADGEPLELEPGVVFSVETPATLGEVPLTEFSVTDLDDPDQFGDPIVVAGGPLAVGRAEQVIEGRVELLQTTGAFQQLTDAAGGAFVTDVDPLSFAVIEADGSFEIVQGDLATLGRPLMTQFELDELLFDDLGIFQDPTGTVVDVDVGGRLLYRVVEVDGIDFLVAADATPVDRSVDRVRTGLWIAVPVLTLVIAAVAWLVTSRALRPVRSITDQAATISGGSLDARVPVPESGDEIATLATTVNEMLDRLEADDTSRRRFISDASHELRSPVAVMRNEAEVALHHPDVSDIGELALTVADESRRMSTIIDDLLALARHDEGVPAPSSPIDLDDIVLQQAERTRRVPVDVARVSAGRVRGRPDELSRMVGHLLDNAARHARSDVAVSLRETDGDVELVVDDDGPGVPDDDRDRIFERFARLDDARTRDQGGAGLGLAVVRGIVERSHGTVDVTDAPCGGARFVVRFPT